MNNADLDFDELWSVKFRSVFFWHQVTKYYKVRKDAEADYLKYQYEKNYIQSGWMSEEIIPPKAHRPPSRIKKN